MSILLGFHSKSSKKEDEKEEEDLLVFGYACKLYHDDVKAVMEGSGQLLIPWMGDSSLMVDRYDVRNKLEDKSQFGLKPNLPRPMSAEELALEEELDKERYLALEWDDIRVEEQEEEERRRKESGFAAIGFTYGNSAPAVEQPQQPAEVSSNLFLPEHPPTSCVDEDEKDPFVPPPGLLIPEGIQAPATNKLHSIIEKTASFIAKQGNQMEIIIKTKQKFNPFFSFLNYKDKLFPYYTHLKDMIVTGGYAPSAVPDVARNGSVMALRKTKEVAAVRNGTSEQKERANSPKHKSPEKRSEVDTNSDSDDSDSDDGGYLHPLLMKGSLKASKPSTPKQVPSPSASGPPTLSAKKLSIEELMNLHSKSSFVARSLAINSAPSLNQGDLATHGQPTPTHHTAYSEADAMAAYEQYKQQYYDSSSGGGDLDASFGYYPPDPSLSPHDAYSYPPGGPMQGAPYSDHYPPYYGHFPHPMPPPDLRPVIDKTAEYVAKNSDNFERTILERHIGDVRFNFLNPWDQYHNYYQAMKQYNRTRLDQEQSWGGGAALNPLPPMPLLASAQQEEEVLRMKPNIQKLSSSGAVSFKLQSKAPPSSAGLSAPEFAPLEESPEPPGDQEEDNRSEQPPPKKQRLQNGDHIENAVQDFLTMVKGEVGGEEETMGSTVEAFLSTVKGMFGADSSN